MLKELFYERWFSEPYKEIKAKDLKNQKWKEYIKEAKKVLKGNNCDDLANNYIEKEDFFTPPKRCYMYWNDSHVQSDIKEILDDNLVFWMDVRFGLLTN